MDCGGAAGLLSHKLIFMGEDIARNELKYFVQYLGWILTMIYGGIRNGKYGTPPVIRDGTV